MLFSPSPWFSRQPRRETRSSTSRPFGRSPAAFVSAVASCRNRIPPPFDKQKRARDRQPSTISRPRHMSTSGVSTLVDTPEIETSRAAYFFTMVFGYSAISIRRFAALLTSDPRPVLRERGEPRRNPPPDILPAVRWSAHAQPTAPASGPPSVAVPSARGRPTDRRCGPTPAWLKDRPRGLGTAGPLALCAGLTSGAETARHLLLLGLREEPDREGRELELLGRWTFEHADKVSKEHATAG